MIKLYLDENVPETVAAALRLRGFNVITVREVDRKGLSDVDQLKYASSENRVIFTFNTVDFCNIHSEFIGKGLEHGGIIISRQLPIGVLVKALSRLLSNTNSEKISNNLIYLSDWNQRPGRY